MPKFGYGLIFTTFVAFKTKIDFHSIFHAYLGQVKLGLKMTAVGARNRKKGIFPLIGKINK